MNPMPLDEAIRTYVVAKGPTFQCGPIARNSASGDTWKVQFCFSKESNHFWSVEASVKNTLYTGSLVEVEKLEDDLYDEAVLMFELRLAEVSHDFKRAAELAALVKLGQQISQYLP
jgi:hypothetical protein